MTYAPLALCCPSCGHQLLMHGAYVQGVTRRQGDILNYLVQRAGRGEVSPSLAEITVAVGGRSKGPICEMVKLLAERGFVERIPGKTRTITLTSKTLDLYRLPQQEVAHAP